MANRIVTLTGILAVLISAPAAAQDPPSPHAAIVERDIKALSAEQVTQLEAGDGMGLALAAELNGYPGPKHLLELADSLDLTATQRGQIEGVRLAMLAEARRLGAEIVARERELDRALATGAVDHARLDVLTAELGRLTGALRFTHLRAHLAVRPLLSEAQRATYALLRGYSTHGGEGHGRQRD